MIIHLPLSADDTPPDLPIDLDSHLHTSTYDDGSQSDVPDTPPDLPIESDSQTSASDDGSPSDQEENDSELNHSETGTKSSLLAA